MSNFFKDIHHIKIGGTKDTLAMSGLGMTGLMATPIVGGLPFLQLPIAAASAAWLGWRYASTILDNNITLSTYTKFKSSIPPDYTKEQFDGGFLIGYCSDTGKPVVVTNDLLTRHSFVAGMTGVGKTVLGNSLMYQQIQRGGGFMFVDGKSVKDNLEDVYQLCASCGRERDLLVIAPGYPELSNTYNPILEGSPSEIASRILALAPSTTNNAGADHYRSSSFNGVFNIVSAFQAAGLKFNFIDISIVLQNAKAMEELSEKVRLSKGVNSEEYRHFSLFLEQFKVPSRPGQEAQLDMKKVKDIFGGLVARMNMFGMSGFGKVMNTYTPEVRVEEAILNNKIIYIMLPTLGEPDAAFALGKMIISDVRSAVASLYEKPKDELPSPPFFVFIDEAGSFASDSWSQLFEQARGAQIMLMPALQTIESFQAISKQFAETIVGNTWTKIVLKISSHPTAQYFADYIGNEKKEESSLSIGTSTGNSANTLRTTPEAKATLGYSVNESIKMTEDYIVSPEMLKNLAMGEAFVISGEKNGEVKVYHCKIPMVKPNKKTIKEVGKFKINRIRGNYERVNGAGFFEHAEKYISKTNT